MSLRDDVVITFLSYHPNLLLVKKLHTTEIGIHRISYNPNTIQHVLARVKANALAKTDWTALPLQDVNIVITRIFDG